jgi:hypothetical protein
MNTIFKRFAVNAHYRILVGVVVAALCSEVPQKAGADLSNKVTLTETRNRGPAMAQLGSVFIGWTGVGNNQLNLASSTDGHTFRNKYTSGETSRDAPALCVHNKTMYIAWTGTNSLLNVAVVNIQGSTVTGFSNKVTLSEMSTQSPALASLNGRLYIGWRGIGNNSLNVMSSADGRTFTTKYTSNETGNDAPALCAHNGRLFIAWPGSGNNLQLNVAAVNHSGASVTGFGNKVTLAETSTERPALASFDGKLFVAWRGTNSDLNLMASADNGRTFLDKYTSQESSLLSPALTPSDRLLLYSWADTQSIPQLNVAQAASSRPNLHPLPKRHLENRVRPTSTPIPSSPVKRPPLHPTYDVLRLLTQPILNHDVSRPAKLPLSWNVK